VATGANDTPLGTPPHASPAPTTTPASHEAPKKSEDAVKALQPPIPSEEPRDMPEKKKEKKRKSIAAEVDEVGGISCGLSQLC